MTTSRELAFQILTRIETEQAYTGIVLDTELTRSGFDARDKALVTELVYGVVRWQKTLDWYLEQVCHKPLRKTHPLLRQILRLGGYQLLFLDKVPASAAINESVKLAGKHSKPTGLPPPKAKGFVNATLRALDRARPTLRAPETILDESDRLATVYSYPEWRIARWRARWDRATTEQICRINNQPPAMIIRVNCLKTSLAELQSRLRAQVQTVTPLPGNLPGLVLTEHPPIAELAEYQNGLFTVQNAASMLIGLVLDPQPGERILDACAGSGTKTTHLAELMQNRGDILAIDLHAGKLDRLQDNCRRMGISIARTWCGDVTHFPERAGNQAFPLYDRVLLDAPCSGLGVLRRHPEAKWTKQPTQIAELQQLQQRLLRHVAAFVRPNGVLVYSTCTTEPEETQHVMTTFLQTVSNFHITPLQPVLPEFLHANITPEGFLLLDPPQEYFDGFFCARLIRIA